MLDILIAEMKQTGAIDYNGICEEVDTFMFEVTTNFDIYLKDNPSFY